MMGDKLYTTTSVRVSASELANAERVPLASSTRESWRPAMWERDVRRFGAVEELPELSAGQSFELREGARVVGYVTVLEPQV
jgi:hypothetical protein